MPPSRICYTSVTLENNPRSDIRIERCKLQLKKLPLDHNAVGVETGTNPQMLIAMRSSHFAAVVEEINILSNIRRNKGSSRTRI